MHHLALRFRSCLLAAALAGFAAPPAEAPAAWSPPVDGRVAKPFVPGVGAFEASGHAGVDYAVPPGTPVRAAGDGVVAFAGDIAGAAFVVVAHGGGLRTSYGQLASTAVRRLRAVERGDVVGTAGGGGMHGHAPGLLHFGLRVDGRPVDPFGLFEPIDLTEVVHLVPSDDAFPEVGSAAAERRLAAQWFSPSGELPPWLLGGRGGGGGGLLGGVLSRIGGGARWLGMAAVAVPLTALEASVEATWVLSSVGEGVADWWRLRRDCTPREGAPPAGSGGTGNHLVVVGGVNSWTHRDGRTNALRPDRLGYGKGDVTWFSYAPDGGPYTREETHAGPEFAASLLAGRLLELARRYPGRVVDLLGHSQGGVVIEAFLKDHYAGHEDEYPPIGEVVTMAAPHKGAPLATLAVMVDRLPEGDALADRAGYPDPDTPTVRDLAEGSPYIARLASKPLPEGVDVTTIGFTGDYLVPADQTRMEGAEHVVVDPAGLNDHGAGIRDEEVLTAVRLATSGLAPACVSLSGAVANRVVPRAIHAVERLATPGPPPEWTAGLTP